MLLIMPTLAIGDGSAARGEYLLRAGACESCHTDHEGGGAHLAGGAVLDSAFGGFYAPNLTPDPETGLGRWTYEDFRRAMIEGIRPDGAPYYPVFPYRWYTGMQEQDLVDLWAYLQSLPPVQNTTPAHDLGFPYSIRSLVWAWRLVNFDEGATVTDPTRSASWNRGAYLVNHLSHCGACHTPKVQGNFLDLWFLAGSPGIPGLLSAPNITPDPATGIGRWTVADVVRALQLAMKPDGTPIRGHMAEYVRSGSGHLSEADLAAMAEYLLALPAVVNAVYPVDDYPLTEQAQGAGAAALRGLLGVGR